MMVIAMIEAATAPVVIVVIMTPVTAWRGRKQSQANCRCDERF
jgi:hypothetical protein